MNAILQQIRDDGKVNYSGETYIRTTTTLGLWATKEWHNPQEIASSNRKLAEAIVSIANNGEWNLDYGGHWWGSTGQSTGINVASLVDYSKLLQKSGPGTVKTSTPIAISNWNAGDFRFAVSTNGNVYIGDKWKKTIFALNLASAQVTQIASGLDIQNVRSLSNGKLIIARTSRNHINPVGISTHLNRAKLISGVTYS